MLSVSSLTLGSTRIWTCAMAWIKAFRNRSAVGSASWLDNQNLMDKPQSADLLFELSHPGRRAHRLPDCDVPTPAGLPASALAETPPPLPEVGEIDLIRHFVNLSGRNMSIDTNFYPLGSCTMKYNPKRHERLAALPGMANLHPLQPDHSAQGMLQMLFEMQNYL